MSAIIGREPEKKILDAIYASKEAELVAVYGRRRVGKTYLVKHHFQSKKCVYFHITGIKNGTLKVQLERYTRVLAEVFYPGVSLKTPENWMDAFEELTRAINTIPKLRKIVLFFDELPWLASRKSGVLQAIEYFWNRYWVDNSRLKLVLCGSSSSWMINKIIKNKGGLHNRVTRKLRLMPFTLEESKVFLHSQGMDLSKFQVLKLYMAIGGIPYYLKQLNKTCSIDQNINKLFFNPDGLFFTEFDEVFSSLFDEADAYKEIIKNVAKSPNGILRNDLEQQNKLTGKGGHLTQRLSDLESAGFITGYIPFKHKRRGTYYRISDEYCYFYLKWIEPVKAQLKQGYDTHYWMSIVNTPAFYSWGGYAFESMCYKHIAQVRKALNIPLSALASPWRYSPIKDSKESGAQIDLLFNRPDNSITLCEIKYTDKPFNIDKKYAGDLRNKKEIFIKVTRTSKQIFMAMISANGIKRNKYSDETLSQVVTLDDLFREI